MLPLYREITAILPGILQEETGLWYDKFCNQWQVRSPKREVNTSLGPRYHVLEGESKKKWISTVTSQGAVGDKKHLAEVIHRMRELTAGMRRIGSGARDGFFLCHRYGPQPSNRERFRLAPHTRNSVSSWLFNKGTPEGVDQEPVRRGGRSSDAMVRRSRTGWESVFPRCTPARTS